MALEGDSARAPTRPLITPDSFNREENWDDWISHFNSASKVNKWNDWAKLLWLEVGLVGKARKAWSRLSTQDKGDYNSAVTALCRRFEPESKHDLYAAEFQTRKSEKLQSKKQDLTYLGTITRSWYQA